MFLSYLFVSGGYQKLTDIGRFHKTIAEYRVLPGSWSWVSARLLPVLELCAGIALLLPHFQVVALAVIGLLLIAYTGAIGINILRGRRDLDCGCAGPGGEQLVSGGLLVRNGALLLLVLALSSSLVSQGISLNKIELSIALLGALLLGLLYQICNLLLANQTKLQRIAKHG